MLTAHVGILGRMNDQLRAWQGALSCCLWLVSSPDPSTRGGMVWWQSTGCCDTMECSYRPWCMLLVISGNRDIPLVNDGHTQESVALSTLPTCPRVLLEGDWTASRQSMSSPSCVKQVLDVNPWYWELAIGSSVAAAFVLWRSCWGWGT